MDGSPMPWDIAAQRRQQMGAGDPSTTPLTIDGPPRTPPPQTPAEQTIQGNQAVASGLDAPMKAAQLRHTQLENAAAQAKATEGQLTPAALDMAARQFIQTGQMPSFGMGGAMQKTAIINHAAQLAGVQGLSPEQMQVGFARFRNQANALKVQEANTQGLKGNEAGALQNLQQYVDQSAQLPLQTGSPFVNSITQFAQRHLWSDPTLGRMDVALANAGGETAKVITGTPQGGGVLSDSAREEYMRQLQGTAPIETKRAILEQLRIDMDNRIKGQMNAINQAYGSLGQINQPGAASAVPVAGGQQGNAQQGQDGSPPVLNIGGAPGAPGGGGQGGGGAPPGLSGPNHDMGGLSTGPTREVPDPASSAVLDRMFKGGAPFDQLNDISTKLTGVPLDPSSYAKTKAWLSAHPGYTGPLVTMTKTVPNTATQQAFSAFSNSAPGAAAGHYIDDVTGGHLDNLTNLVGGDGDLTNFGLDVSRQAHPYASIAGDVGAGASLYGLGKKIGGRLIGEAASRLPSWAATPITAVGSSPIAGDAALGGYMGSGANGTDLVSPSDMMKGAATAAAGGAAVRGVANVMGGAASTTGGRMPLLDQQGVVSSVGQRAGGVLDSFEKMNQAIPFLGAPIRNTRNAAIDQAQRGAFNTALQDIGEQLPPGTVKGTQAQAFMQNRFDNAYEQARSGMQFVPDKPYLQDLAGFQQQLGDGTLNDKQAAQVGQRIQTAVGSRLQAAGGQLSGDAYSGAANDLTQTARTWAKNPATSAMADALHDYIGIMDDAAARASDHAAVAQLQAAQKGYAKAVVIENAARMGTGGEFTGKQLDIAAKNSSPSVRSRTYLRGDAPMQDYANQMSMLGNPSDVSPEAKWVAGGAAGMGAISHPAFAIPSLTNMAANLPGIRNIVNTGLLPDNPMFAPMRAYINGRKNLAGSLFAAPLAASQLSQ